MKKKKTKAEHKIIDKKAISRTTEQNVMKKKKKK